MSIRSDIILGILRQSDVPMTARMIRDCAPEMLGTSALYKQLRSLERYGLVESIEGYYRDPYNKSIGWRAI